MDDLPLVPPLHVALDRPAHQPGTGQVHREDTVEVLERVHPDVEVVVDGGIVDENVDLPEALGDPRRECVRARLVGHVDVRRHGLGTERLTLGGHRPRLIVADIPDDDPRSLTREPQRVRTADPLRRTGDDRYSVPQPHAARRNTARKAVSR